MGDTISKKVTHRLFCTLRYIKHINRRLTKAARERGRAKKRCGRVLCEKSGCAEQHQVVERLDAGNQRPVLPWQLWCLVDDNCWAPCCQDPPTPSEGLLVYVCGLIKRLRINKGSTEVFGLKVDFSTVLLFLSTQFHVAVQTKEHIWYSRQAHLFTPAAVGSDQ